MTPSGMGTLRLRVTTRAWVSAGGKCINRLTRRLVTLMVETPLLCIDSKQPHLKGLRKNSPDEVEINVVADHTCRSRSSPTGPVRALAGSGIASARPRPFGCNRLEPLQVIWGERDGAGFSILLQVRAPPGAGHRHHVLPLCQQPCQGPLP